jgi:hypothetical protein
MLPSDFDISEPVTWHASLVIWSHVNFILISTPLENVSHELYLI